METDETQPSRIANISFVISDPESSSQMDWAAIVLEQRNIASNNRNDDAQFKIESFRSQSTDLNEFHPQSIFVFDTSALLANENLVSKSVESQFTCIIPFHVLHELDSFKNANNRICQQARRVNSLLFKLIKSNRFLNFEASLECDEAFAAFSCLTNDDFILKTAMRAKAKASMDQQVFLITNDINLSNKSFANAINPMNHRELSRYLSSAESDVQSTSLQYNNKVNIKTELGAAVSLFEPQLRNNEHTDKQEEKVRKPIKHRAQSDEINDLALELLRNMEYIRSCCGFDSERWKEMHKLRLDTKRLEKALKKLISNRVESKDVAVFVDLLTTLHSFYCRRDKKGAKISLDRRKIGAEMSSGSMQRELKELFAMLKKIVDDSVTSNLH